MFKANTKTSELRLIDFGCATMDETVDVEHITFAGTPFYISPEMFQKKYTTKTDVFSVGVALYVLVGGYPAADLQTAFNLLQKSKRDLKTLPGMPDNMPETYYEMLDKMLTYRYKGRKSAGEMLDDEFVLFHQHLEGDVPLKKRMSMKRTQSMLLTGSGEKAAIAFEFSKFERSGMLHNCVIESCFHVFFVPCSLNHFCPTFPVISYDYLGEYVGKRRCLGACFKGRSICIV